MPFTLQLRVDPLDLDELQHVNNVVYVRWAQDAAVAHSASLGMGVEWYLERGAAFVVRRQEIDYLRPALKDDEIEVQTQVSALSPATAERRTEIRRVRDGQVLARGVTTWAFVEVATGRPVRIPEDVRSRFPLEPVESGTARPKR